MPNIVGKFTLSEIRERVWDRLDARRPMDVDPVTGEGVPPYTIDPLYPRTTVDQFINTSLAAHGTDVIINGVKIFADEEVVDIARDTVEYSIPVEAMFIRSLWWKPPELAYTIIPPSERLYMYEWDEDGPVPDELANGAPTYRRLMNFFVLNEPPERDNPQGVLVKYVKWPNYLDQDSTYIESEFAQLLQEVIIWDVAINLLATRAQLEPPTAWVNQLQSWENRLTVAVRNATMPPFVQAINHQPLLHKKRIRSVRQ